MFHALVTKPQYLTHWETTCILNHALRKAEGISFVLNLHRNSEVGLKYLKILMCLEHIQFTALYLYFHKDFGVSLTVSSALYRYHPSCRISRLRGSNRTIGIFLSQVCNPQNLGNWVTIFEGNEWNTVDSVRAPGQRISDYLKNGSASV
jgi:hypothetical protein